MCLLITIGVGAAGTGEATAETVSPCGDRQPPDTDCRPLFVGNELVQIKAGVPFVWLRDYPTSPRIVATVWPSSGPGMVIVGVYGHTPLRMG